MSCSLILDVLSYRSMLRLSHWIRISTTTILLTKGWCQMLPNWNEVLVDVWNGDSASTISIQVVTSIWDLGDMVISLVWSSFSRVLDGQPCNFFLMSLFSCIRIQISSTFFCFILAISNWEPITTPWVQGLPFRDVLSFNIESYFA